MLPEVVCCCGKSRPIPGSAAGRPYTLLEKEAWEEECEELREAGHRKKDLPKVPRRPKKADVLAAMGEDDEGASEDNHSSDESDDEGVGGEIEDDDEEVNDNTSEGE